MINPDTRENIIVKTEQAQECTTKALQLCEKYSHAQAQKYLKEMGGYLGTFVNNLRSALNYAIVDYCTQRGFAKNKKGKAISTDFPYGFTADKFKSIEVVALMSQFDPKLYIFIEGIQPYHPKQTLLSNIMKISNMDKHKVLAKVQDMDINFFKIIDKGFFEPRHFGSAILTGVSNGKPAFVATPCYVPQIRMFALRNGKWLNFMIPIDDYFLEFIPFMTNAANQVVNTLNEFYSLWN